MISSENLKKKPNLIAFHCVLERMAAWITYRNESGAMSLEWWEFRSMVFARLRLITCWNSLAPQVILFPFLLFFVSNLTHANNNNNSLTYALLCLLLITAKIMPWRGLLQICLLNFALAGCSTHSGWPDLDEHMINLMISKNVVEIDSMMW